MATLASRTFTGSTGTSHAVTIGTHAAGDVLIVALSRDSISAVTTPSGWTLLASVTNNTSGHASRLAVFARIAAGSGTTLTITGTGSEDAEAAAEVWTGHGVTTVGTDLLYIADASGANATTTGWPTLSGLSSSATYSATAYLATSRGDGAELATGVPPSGWTNWATGRQGSSSTTGAGLGVMERTVSGSSSVTAGTTTFAIDLVALRAIIAIPDASAGPVQHDGAGTVPAVSTVAGAITKASPATGSVTAASTVAGAATKATPASSAVVVSSTVTGAATVVPAGLTASGTVVGISTVTGTITKTTSVSGTVVSSSAVTGTITKRITVSGNNTSISVVTGTVRQRHQASGVVHIFSVVLGALQSITAPPLPPTILLRPTALVEAGGVVLDSVSGEVTLDATRVPYAVASIDFALTDPDDVEALDPRDDVRVDITAGDEYVGTSRDFDLGLRQRTIDHKAKTGRMMMASDEAILMEYAPTETDIGAFAFQDSLRGVINYVLDKIDAELEPATVDASVRTYTDATNLIPDPGSAASGVSAGEGYSAGNASLDSNDATWSISGDGDSYNVWAPTNADSYLRVGDAGAGVLRFGVQAGKTYVFSATGNVKTLFTGTDLAADPIDSGGSSQTSRVRALVVHSRIDSGAYSIWHSPKVPNVVGAPTRVSVEFTVPEGTTEAFLRAYLGNTAGQIRWDGFSLVEKDPRPGVDNTVYFDGDTTDTAEYSYVWEGTPDASKSKRIALIDRAPELLVWEPSVTAWDFLTPIATTSGLRLYCDEHRFWRLIDPAEWDVPGVLTVAGFNATEGTDTISRDDPEIWCTNVVLKYRWTDYEGNQQEATDVAGVPGPTLLRQYDRPYPGPGAAAAMLARRQGAGRVQDVTALANWNATPGMEARISLPSTIDQQGTLQSVTWSLDNGLMQVGTGNLLDLPPGSINALEGTVDGLTGTIDSL